MFALCVCVCAWVCVRFAHPAPRSTRGPPPEGADERGKPVRAVCRK